MKAANGFFSKTKRSVLHYSVIAAVCAVNMAVPITASAEEKPTLASLIACHEALAERSDGTSQKMTVTPGAQTPIVFQSGSQILFVTDSTISVLANKNKEWNGKKFVVALPEKTETRREMNLRPDGSVGSVCCGDGSAANPKLPEVSITTELTPRTRAAFKNELAQRLQTVWGSYQTHYDGTDTADALEKCAGFDFKVKFRKEILTVEGLGEKYKAEAKAAAEKEALKNGKTAGVYQTQSKSEPGQASKKADSSQPLKKTGQSKTTERTESTKSKKSEAQR